MPASEVADANAPHSMHMHAAHDEQYGSQDAGLHAHANGHADDVTHVADDVMQATDDVMPATDDVMHAADSPEGACGRVQQQGL